MSDGYIIGVNGAPRSYKSTLCNDIANQVNVRGERYIARCLGYTDMLASGFIRLAGNLTSSQLTYEEAKDVILPIKKNDGARMTGRELLIAMIRGIQAEAHDFLDQLLAAHVESVIATLADLDWTPVILISNVGDREESAKLQRLAEKHNLQYSLIYMTDKRERCKDYKYEADETFFEDSRSCLQYQSDFTDPTAEFITSRILGAANLS